MEYDQGTVAAVMTVEHMGARNYEAEPRPGGRARAAVGRHREARAELVLLR